jgi:hypothetical protein
LGPSASLVDGGGHLDYAVVRTQRRLGEPAGDVTRHRLPGEVVAPAESGRVVEPQPLGCAYPVRSGDVDDINLGLGDEFSYSS